PHGTPLAAQRRIPRVVAGLPLCGTARRAPRDPESTHVYRRHWRVGNHVGGEDAIPGRLEMFHMSTPRALLLPAALVLAACSREQPAVDPQLAAAIAGIKAIDNHAHPVLAAPGDREFDALPVDHMEPQSDPVAMRPGAFQTPFTAESKAAAKRQRGDGYPAWVLEQMGVETMLANRVAMGTSVQPPRFRWVPYADALIFPLDNAHLAAKNSDRKAFFALEDKLRARYLAEAGLSAPPATLGALCRCADLSARQRAPRGEKLRP